MTATTILAQSAGSQDEAAVAAFLLILFGVLCGSMLIAILIQVFIAWYLSTALKALPPEHRKQEPGMCWLLLIPIFYLVWNFFVHPKIAQSYQSYFASKGRTDMGDCGYNLALAYSICAAISIVPYANCLALPAALVMLIIWLVKVSNLKAAVAQN